VEVPLPPNVHRPERNVTERYALESHGNHIADIACRSFVSREPIAAKEFGVARRGTPSADAPVTIAAAYGRLGRDLADGTASDLPALFDHETLRHPDIPCWCLGGDHAPRTHSAAPHTVRVCGTPQGRSQRDEGPRSCTLYDVDAAGNVQHRPIETDAIRFVNETVHLDEDFSVEDAKLFLDEAITALIHSVGKRHAVIHWEIVAEGPVANQLESIAGNAEMLEYLQTTYGTSDPVIWSADLEVIGNRAVKPQRYREDTILGLNLAELLPAGAGEQMERAARIEAGQPRRDVLLEAARLGVELLSGNRQEV